MARRVDRRAQLAQSVRLRPAPTLEQGFVAPAPSGAAIVVVFGFDAEVRNDIPLGAVALAQGLAQARKSELHCLAPEGLAARVPTDLGFSTIHSIRGIPAVSDPAAATRGIAGVLADLPLAAAIFPDDIPGDGDIARRLACLLGETFIPRAIIASDGQVRIMSPDMAVETMVPFGKVLSASDLGSPRRRPAIQPHVRRHECRYDGDASYCAVPATYPPSDAIPLAEARLVAAAGDGVDDWPTFFALAARLGAAVGGTRVVCDAGHLPRSRQIGASGESVAADLYLALGISGSVQHLQGLRHCKRIVAVNTDVNAEMMKHADLAVVHDVQAVMPHLLRLTAADEGAA